MGLLVRAQLLLVAPLLLYGTFVVLLGACPPLQRTLVFMHIFNFPTLHLLHEPTAYGFGYGQVRLLNISTPDGVSLGAWHVMPHDTYRDFVEEHGHGRLPPDTLYDRALAERPCLVYSHGNAGNRGTGHRRRMARHISEAGYNGIFYDYRGFGDSSTHLPPDEAGVVADAHAVWDWLTRDKGVPAGNIGLAGQSLGTAVTAALAGHVLAPKGIVPKAVILIAPFTSIMHLAETYKLGGIVPLLGPLVSLPGAYKLIMRFALTHFDTRAALQEVRAPILIIHSRDDADILHSHAATLFEDLARREVGASTDLISEMSLGPNQGVARRAGSVLYVDAVYGGHNAVGYSETSLSFIRQVLG